MAISRNLNCLFAFQESVEKVINHMITINFKLLCIPYNWLILVFHYKWLQGLLKLLHAFDKSAAEFHMSTLATK